MIASPLMPTVVPHLRRLTVAEYHQMIDKGILKSGEKIELLDGFLVQKMTINPPHSFTLQATLELIFPLLPASWVIRIQQPITLPQSEPEPDVVLARGNRRTYAARHPGPADVELVIEVSDSSLILDQTVKGPLYAAAGIPTYWILDVVNRHVEVYTLVSGGGYGPATILTPGQQLPLNLASVHLGDLAVADLFV